MPSLKYQSAPGVWTPLSLVEAPPPTAQVFTTVGASTWTKPVGALYCVIEVQAGGGGGGGCPASAVGSRSFGAGGGAGGYSRSTILASQLGATETVTVGAGGAVGAGVSGSAGGGSSFGTWVTANGGAGGPATGSTNTTYGGNGAAGGTPGTGDIAIPGAVGENGWGDVDHAMAGNGGVSILGSGGRGGTGAASQAFAGTGAGGYGGGGGGSVVNNSVASAQSGGLGSQGVVIVTTYYGTGGGAGVANPTFTTVSASSDVEVQGASLPRGVPSGTNGLAQITASVTPTQGGALVPITGLSITPTLDPTRRYRIRVSGHLTTTVVNDRGVMGICEGAGNTLIGQAQGYYMPTTGSAYWLEYVIYVSGVSGAKNYKAGICRGPGATGTISMAAGVALPAIIVIEDVGAA